MDKRKFDITSCIACESRLFFMKNVSERRNGVMLKPGKIYCIFPKKPIKLDARKLYTGIPVNCPRYSVPVRFAVYTLKKKSQAVDNAACNANKYWRVYSGDVTITTHKHLLMDGTYSEPEIKDGYIYNGETPICKLQHGDVVVREDGFKAEAWNWNSRYFMPIHVFDEKGIKKKPERKKV